MSIVIRPVDLQTDRATLLAVFERMLPSAADPRRFHWLYRENPHGPARAWLAADSRTGEWVGAAAIFPRRLRRQDAATEGYVLGDFCLDRAYRALGPAIQLQRACLAEIASHVDSLAYDFPSESMLAVYRRMGFEANARLVRFAKPLRLDQRIAQRVSVRLLAKTIAAAARVGLRARDFNFRRAKGCVVDALDSDFGPEFSALMQRAGRKGRVCVERSADYLNWRYRRHPAVRHEVLTARRSGSLHAYLVFAQAGDQARVVDAFGADDPEILRSLLAVAANRLRDRGAQTLSFPLLSQDPWSEWLLRWGFRPRESSGVVTLPANPGSEMRTQSAWFLVDGDRES